VLAKLQLALLGGLLALLISGMLLVLGLLQKLLVLLVNGSLAFESKAAALLSNDHTDLDVEIGVLRERLALEGPSALSTSAFSDATPSPVPLKSETD
jgi:hypothetical protein